MKNLAILLLFSLAIVPACSDDATAPPNDPNSPKYMPLTSREAVVNNFELAWNKRQPQKLDELLDADYTFYFAPGDVGGEIPSSWNRTFDLAATTALFESNSTPPIPPAPVCRSIRFDLQLDDLAWTEIVDTTLGETWHAATVPYSFTFEMEPDQTYINEGNAKAQFTVREVTVGAGTEWRLVQLRDLASSFANGSRETASTASTSCGKIKALYRGFPPLTSKLAVLNGLELAWNRRAPDEVDELLDDNFVFFFAAGDVGGTIPAQWNRATELATSTALLLSNTTPTTGPVCGSVQVDLTLNNVQWVEFVPEDAPAETWYATTVFYTFTFEMKGDVTYVAPPGSKAQFTVRNAGSGGVQDWRLVEWRDLGSNNVTSGSSQAAVIAMTWGRIKALYM